eukprot:6461322-Amphidinium_carterae.1
MDIRASWLEDSGSRPVDPMPEVDLTEDNLDPSPVAGGTCKGQLARRSFRKGLLTSCIPKIERSVRVKVAKGKDVEVFFKGVISTSEILTRCARAKRVGRGYLALHWVRESGRRTFTSDTLVHESKTWLGQTLILENQRHLHMVNGEGPSVEEYEREQASLEVAFAKRHGKHSDRKRARENLDDALRRLDPSREWKPSEAPVQKAKKIPSDIEKQPLGESERGDSKVTSSQDVSACKGPMQVIKLEVKGELTVPVAWTDRQICHRLAQRFKVKNNRVVVFRSCTSSKQKPLARVIEADMEFQPWVQGAGKSQRVGQQSLEAVVVAKLKQDILISPGLSGIENRLVEHLVRSDAKLTRAAFQAKSIPQRLEALSAAFHRTGLPDLRAQTKEAAEEHRRQLQAANIAEEAASSMGESWSVDDRQRQGRAEKKKTEHGVDRELMDELSKKVKALELWAHAVDANQEQLPSQASTCDTIVRTVELRLRELAAHQIQMYFEGRKREAVDKAVKVLPLTPQGMMVEHALVQQILERDSAAVQDITRAQLDTQVYQALAKALHRGGQRRLALGLVKAAESMDKKDEPEEGAAEPTDGQQASLEEEMWTAITEADLELSQSPDEQTDFDMQDSGEGSVTTDPYQQSGATRKRGRPPGPAKQAQDQVQTSLSKMRARIEAIGAALAEMNKRVKETMQKAADLEGKAQVKQGGLSFLQAEELATLSKLTTTLDKSMAEMGKDNLTSAASLRQVREAVGLKEFDPLATPPEDGCAEVCIPLAIQLIESRLLSVERSSGTTDGERDPWQAIKECSSKVEACENKIINFGTTMERVAKVCQTVWNSSQHLNTRLQMVHETAAMAIQQTSALRALVAPTAF